MNKVKKLLSILFSLAFAGIISGTAFLMPNENQASAQTISYDEVDNNLPEYFVISTDENAGNVNNEIFLLNQSGNLSVKIADDTINAKKKDDLSSTVTNYAYKPDKNDDDTYYYFNFQSSSLSLYYNITNKDIASGKIGTNLLSGQGTANYLKTYTTEGDTQPVAGIPKGLDFTPQQLGIKFTLDTSKTEIGFGTGDNTNEIILAEEGCYTLGIPLVPYKTTNGGETFVAENPAPTIYYTFMVFKADTYFATNGLPHISASNNVQETTLVNNSEFSKYYFHNYSSTNANQMPTLTFNPNHYQFAITYTDINNNKLYSNVSYKNGRFVQTDENGIELDETNKFVYTTFKKDEENNDIENQAMLVFNDLGEYEITVSYLYKAVDSEGNETHFTLPLDDLQGNYGNKKQKMFVYGYQAVYSDYSNIDPLTNQPVPVELKTTDTSTATFTQSADITSQVVKTFTPSDSTPNPNNSTSYALDNLKNSAVSAINANSLTPISTNQTPIKFLTNATLDSTNSKIYKMTKTASGWEVAKKADTGDEDREPFNGFNQNEAGTYLYIIQYKYDKFMTTSGTLLSLNYHYQVFFFTITSQAPTITVFEETTGETNTYTELFTKSFTNKSVYLIDDSTENPYDAKVEILVSAYDYTNKRFYFQNQNIENLTFANYETFTTQNGDADFNSKIAGKRGIYISNDITNPYRNAKWTISVKSAGATNPSIMTFTTDNQEIQGLTARNVTKSSNKDYYLIGDQLTSPVTNQSIILSWKEKASGATTYGYVKYIPMEANDYYNTADISELLLKLKMNNGSEYPVAYQIDLSKITTATWVEYLNTTNNTSEILSSSTSIKSSSGLYLLEVYDSAGNAKFEIFIIDNTSPVFVKLEYNEDDEIETRSIMANGDTISVPNNATSKVYIEWSSTKAFKLENLTTFDSVSSYAYNSNKTYADEKLKETLETFFSEDSTSQFKVKSLTGIDTEHNGKFYCIPVEDVYYYMDSNTSQFARKSDAATLTHAYNVNLFRTENGETVADERQHTLLVRDKSNTINYGDEATNYKNASSGYLTFRVSSDDSKLDIKLGSKPTDGTNWDSLSLSNYSFQDYLYVDDKDNPTEFSAIAQDEYVQAEKDYKYKYSYLTSANAKQEITLSYIPYPSSGVKVDSITLTYYPFVKTYTQTGNNYYCYYTLDTTAKSTITIYPKSDSSSIGIGDEQTFEIALGSSALPLGGKYVIERDYCRNVVNEEGDITENNIEKINQYDYFRRTLSFTIDPYNVISAPEEVSTDGDASQKSLESVVGGDILISMYSDKDNSLEISFPKYQDNGLNQGTFYSKSSFVENEDVSSIAVAGNKLPLKLLIPEYKYTISSVKSEIEKTTNYEATTNPTLSYYGGAEIVENTTNNSWDVKVDGITAKTFATKADAEEYLATASIVENQLYAKIEFVGTNNTKTTYHGGNYSAIINLANAQNASSINDGNYMNFYDSADLQKGILSPVSNFTAPGKYTVTLYQANNRGSQFGQYYDFYKFAFEITSSAPEFDIINSDGYSLEKASNNNYYTNSNKLTIQWEVPTSEYVTKIDEAKIVVNNETIGSDIINTDSASTHYFILEIADALMTNKGSVVTIKMQFEGHNGQYYQITEKTIYFDVVAPTETLQSLMSKVESSSKVTNGTAYLTSDFLRQNTRTNLDFKGAETTDMGEASYSYSSNAMPYKYYTYSVRKDFADTLQSVYNNRNASLYDTQSIYYRQIIDLNTYTQVDKSSFNSGNYNEFSNEETTFVEGMIYEIVERDSAGNMCVYLVKIEEDNKQLDYTNANTDTPSAFDFTTDKQLYSNTGFEIENINFKSDNWQMFSVRLNPLSTTYTVYLTSPWLTSGNVYKVTLSEGQPKLEEVKLDSIFKNANGEYLASSNVKKTICFADKANANTENLYLTILDASLTANKSVEQDSSGYIKAVLKINIPSSTQYQSSLYGYVFPKEVKIELLTGSTYTEIAKLTSPNGLFGAWQKDGPDAQTVEVTPQNNTLDIKVKVDATAKLKYTITDNFGNTSTIIQLTNEPSYNEISGDRWYKETEADGSTTYISDKPLTFTYASQLHGISVFDLNETEQTLSFTTNKDNTRSYTFKLTTGKTSDCWKVEKYDADDESKTTIETIYIRLYNTLPSLATSEADNGVKIYDRNYELLSATDNKTARDFKVGERTLNVSEGKQITTYSQAVTITFPNSEIASGDAFYNKTFPYSAWLSSDGGQNFVKITQSDSTETSQTLRGAGEYIVLLCYDDEKILVDVYKAFYIEILDSTASYYTVEVNGKKVERADLAYTDTNGQTYEVNYIVALDYNTNRNSVAITENEELGVTISRGAGTPVNGTDIYVEKCSYTCKESSGDFVIIYIKESSSFVSNFGYETAAGTSESLLSETSKTIVAKKETDFNYTNLKLSFTPYFGIKANKINIRIEKLFNSEFIDVTPEVVRTDSQATATIDRPGYYRISLYDSCTPANEQLFKGNKYIYISFLSSAPFVVSSTDSEGTKVTTEPINHAIYNSNVEIALTDLSRYYHPSAYPVISVEKNGKEYKGYTESNYKYTFTEPGFYMIKFSAKATTEAEIREEEFYFTIVNKNESRYAFEFTKYNSYYIEKVEKDGFDITEDIMKIANLDTVTINGQKYLAELSLSFLDEKTGGGRYKITVCPNQDNFSSVGVKSFTFECWINMANPPLEVSVEEGGATTDTITVKFNVQNFYNAVGDCYIKIGSYTLNVNSDTIASLNENSTISITNSGTYFIQVYTTSGNLIYSYKVTKNEPLNAFAIIAIVIAVIAVGAVVFITIKLRKRQKVK